LHPREQTNKDSLTRMQKAHAHTHAVPCSSCLREREREREREKLIDNQEETEGR